MIRSLIFLVAQRGAGSLLYATVAAWTLPASNIVSSIYLIATFEFVFGMILPTLRTSALAGNISMSEVIYISVFASIISSLVTFYFWSNEITSFILLLSLIILPVITQKLIIIEKLNINESLKIDAQSALIGSIVSSGLLILFHTANVSKSLSSPLLRGLMIILTQLFLLKNISIDLKKITYSFEKSLILRITAGLDYLSLLSAIKTKLLTSLSFIGYDAAVKIVVLIYDPLASLMGYHLRSMFKKSDFDTFTYFKNTVCLFLVLSLSSVLFSILSLYSTVTISILSASVATTLLLLSVAGLTTHAVLINFKERAILLSVLIIGIILLAYDSRLEYTIIYLSIALGIEIIILSNKIKNPLI